MAAPIGISSKAQVRPSYIIVSLSSPSPMRYPKRALSSTYGALDIDSMPPATTMSNSPSLISDDARAIAAMPDGQTLLIVSAGTSSGMPPLFAAWREVIWPWPACRTWPMTTYSTWSPATPARSSAPLMAWPPRSMADSEDSPPPNLPIGVRAYPTTTVSCMGCLLCQRRMGAACARRRPW